MPAKKILVVGSCNTDMVIKAERLPLPGETIMGGTFYMNPGGKGANQAVAAARMGGKVTFITKTGDDIFGKQMIAGYMAENIDTSRIFCDPVQPSGVAMISVDASGENCIVVASGANATLSPADIQSVKGEIENSGLVLMQLEIPVETVAFVAALAQNYGVRVVLNPAPAQALPESLFQNLYAIIPNRTEAGILSGIAVSDMESACRAADIISNKGVAVVVITLGSEGALIREQDDYHFVESIKVDAVDTTAAGDTFCGAFCVGLSEGLSVHDSVRLAVRAAAISVTRLGAQSSAPYRSEL
jgi:ribokinase